MIEFASRVLTSFLMELKEKLTGRQPILTSNISVK